MSEMTASQIMYEIKRAYAGRKSKEEILAMYAAVQNKEDTDSGEAGRTYVHLAAGFSDADAVAYLLSQGLKAGAKDEYQRTPLHYLAEGSRERADAAAEDIEKTAKLLLDAKVSALLRDGNDSSLCYHIAAKSGNAAFLDAMIKNKVKLDMTDSEGRTVLHLLVTYPSQSIKSSLKYEKNEEAKKKLEAKLDQIFNTAKALIACGIDPDAKDNAGKTAADYAAQYELGKLAALLKGEYDETDASNEDKIAAGGKSLQQACKDKDLKALEALIKLGKDVNEVSGDSPFNEQTPLAAACMNAFPEGVDALLKAGADPNFRTGENGRSALFYMINLGDFGRNKDDAKTMGKILKSLIAYKLDINGFADNDENTPLTLACAPRTE
ncbi:MAG: hypothetical protein FWC57_00805, partial [Endomicrobia bacterium]|nr:hypothetical protein [Endomicrobiia bacterium]